MQSALSVDWPLSIREAESNPERPDWGYYLYGRSTEYPSIG